MFFILVIEKTEDRRQKKKKLRAQGTGRRAEVKTTLVFGLRSPVLFMYTNYKYNTIL